MFDMFLSGAAGWLTGKVLDTLLRCNTCAQEKPAQVGNEQWNHLECKNCHKQTDQFTNACEATVDRKTRQIGHGEITQCSWSWEKFGFWSETFGTSKARRLAVPFQLVERGLKGRTLVFEFALRDFDSDQVIVGTRSIWKPCHCADPHCKNNYFHYWYPGATFQGKKIVACDVKLLSEHKDLLFEQRILKDVTKTL